MNKGLIFICLIIFVMSCSSAPAPLSVGGELPAVQVEMLTGGAVSLSSHKGEKGTVVALMTLGCDSCFNDLPALEKSYAAYRDKGLKQVVVSVGTKRAEVETFLKDMPLTEPVLLDTDGGIMRHFGTVILPTTYIFNADGVLVEKLQGELDVKQYAELIDSVMAASGK